MPWKESDRMDQRAKFVRDLKSGSLSMVEACQRYGISRPTGYKWLERFEACGEAALEDRPPIAVRQPQRTPPEIVRALVAARRRLRWGPKKLVAVLRELEPECDWPAASTVGRSSSGTAWCAGAADAAAGGTPGTTDHADGPAQRGVDRRLQGAVQ